MQKIIFYLSYFPVRFFAKILPPKQALILLFNLYKRILTLISDRASDYENGIHPKHRLMKYHDFFVSRLKQGEKVLDIGSGIGFLAFDMARVGAQVTGIELSAKNISKAERLYQDKNLKFIHGDALKNLPHERFDTVVMSNVLEHIDNRVEFIRKVQTEIKPHRWLIRVPCFDRDWTVALTEELGLDSRLDETHFIEFTKESFENEMRRAGLNPIHLEVRWGEIWSELSPVR